MRSVHHARLVFAALFSVILTISRILNLIIIIIFVTVMFHFMYSIIDLTERVGPLELPTNQTGSIEVAGLSLTGEMGLWGRSLVLKDNYSSRTICASITVI